MSFRRVGYISLVLCYILVCAYFQYFNVIKQIRFRRIEILDDNDSRRKSIANYNSSEKRKSRNGSIETHGDFALEKDVRIEGTNGLSAKEFPMRMSNVFPRNACANFSLMTRLYNFTGDNLCGVFVPRQEQ